jgi:hypothetical protein
MDGPVFRLDIPRQSLALACQAGGGVDQIHEHQIEVPKLADDNPFKSVLRERVARYGEMTEKLRDGELDAGNAVKAMQALEGVL